MLVSLVSLARRAGCGAIVASALVVAPARGAPPTTKSPSTTAAKQACVAAHEEAQKHRVQKKLHAARERYVACARAECPLVLRKECSEQLDQMEEAAPTIVLEALDDRGSSDAQVKVTVDGELVGERLTGGAIPVEPGEHVVVFERASDGKRLEQRVLVVEGEKNRKVVADYQTLAPKPPEADSNGARPPEAATTVPVVAFVAGGIALAGLGSFAFFSLSGMGTEDDLAKRCAPRCADDDVAAVKRDYAIADVSLAVSVIAAAAAVVLAMPALASSRHTAAIQTRTPPPWMPRPRVVR